jgi:hypothetical protein
MALSRVLAAALCCLAIVHGAVEVRVERGSGRGAGLPALPAAAAAGFPLPTLPLLEPHSCPLSGFLSGFQPALALHLPLLQAAVQIPATNSSETPSFVLLSHDDALLDSSWKIMWENILQASDARNPNGCRIPVTWVGARRLQATASQATACTWMLPGAARLPSEMCVFVPWSQRHVANPTLQPALMSAYCATQSHLFCPADPSAHPPVHMLAHCSAVCGQAGPRRGQLRSGAERIL